MYDYYLYMEFLSSLLLWVSVVESTENFEHIDDEIIQKI